MKKKGLPGNLCAVKGQRASKFYIFITRTIITTVSIVSISGCVVKPKPLSSKEIQSRIQHDMAAIRKSQYKPKASLNLYQVMARAIKYNLDYRLKKMEAVLAYNQFKMARLDMLPSLMTEAGYTTRSNLYASSSQNVINPGSAGTFGASTSQDINQTKYSLELSWHILNFGLNYFTAKQQANVYLINKERQHRIAQNIMRDVRYAYWRAVATQKLSRRLAPVENMVNHALKASHISETSHDRPPLKALNYQHSLLDTMRKIISLEKDLYNAKSELSALIDVPPNTHYRLLEKTPKRALPLHFSLNIKELENMALHNRSELREEDYRQRIDADEIRKIRLDILPDFKFVIGQNYESNSFLLNQHWANAGITLLWNTMKLITNPEKIKWAKNTFYTTQLRRLALSVTILTQVDIAYLRYLQTNREFKFSRKLLNVDKRIYKHIRNEYRAGKNSQLDMIQAKVNYMLSELRYDLIYAEWQNAGGQLLNSVGYDVLDGVTEKEKLSIIGRQLAAHFLRYTTHHTLKQKKGRQLPLHAPHKNSVKKAPHTSEKTNFHAIPKTVILKHAKEIAKSSRTFQTKIPKHAKEIAKPRTTLQTNTPKQKKQSQSITHPAIIPHHIKQSLPLNTKKKEPKKAIIKISKTSKKTYKQDGGGDAKKHSNKLVNRTFIIKNPSPSHTNDLIKKLNKVSSHVANQFHIANKEVRRMIMVDKRYPKNYTVK